VAGLHRQYQQSLHSCPKGLQNGFQGISCTTSLRCIVHKTQLLWFLPSRKEEPEEASLLAWPGGALQGTPVRFLHDWLQGKLAAVRHRRRRPARVHLAVQLAANEHYDCLRGVSTAARTADVSRSAAVLRSRAAVQQPAALEPRGRASLCARYFSDTGCCVPFVLSGFVYASLPVAMLTPPGHAGFAARSAPRSASAPEAAAAAYSSPCIGTVVCSSRHGRPASCAHVPTQRARPCSEPLRQGHAICAAGRGAAVICAPARHSHDNLLPRPERRSQPRAGDGVAVGPRQVGAGAGRGAS